MTRLCVLFSGAKLTGIEQGGVEVGGEDRLTLPELFRLDLLLSSFHSHFLASAGSDRKIKFWDLRRPYEPINSIKRFLSTELAWLLPYNGVTVAQDNCYASYGRMERGWALGTGPRGWGALCQIIVGRGGLFHFGSLDSGGRKESNLRKRKIFFSLSLTVMDSVEFTTLMLVTLVSRPISLLLEKALSGWAPLFQTFSTQANSS